jgi:hypothetical protein
MTHRLNALLIAYLVCLGIQAQTDKGTLHLFHEDVKTKASPVVYDFLERYLYKISHEAHGFDFYQSMADDKVVVKGGSLDNIAKLSPESLFSLIRYDDKGYDACWQDSTGHVLLDIQFPIQFELLLGQPKSEIEKEMQDLLKSYPDTMPRIRMEQDLQYTSDGFLSSASPTYYYIKEVNTSTYYEDRPLGKAKAVFSEQQKAYSAANLLQGVINEAYDYKLYIEQNMYNFGKKQYSITLKQWLNYCREQKLTIYFGVEEERVDGMKALLIVQSPDLGYNHVMSLILPDNFVNTRDAVIKATLNAYIPTDNVKEPYQQPTPNNPRKKI